MNDRTVHASARSWEIVRYDRSGKWYVEWLGTRGKSCPVWVGPPHCDIAVNGANRAPVTIGKAVTAAIGLGATVHFGKPGGSTFDREYRRKVAA